MSELPKTEEECKWWKIGLEQGIKETTLTKEFQLGLKMTLALDEVYKRRDED